ncbi:MULTISPECIES: SufB/SufD family protein [Candidatus Nitrosocaldus]|jgi:FeS assembly protein SufD|uniref:Putative FeS cluster assembly protein sufD n=1 Tax=Candidatus Nitrosocaldus cavascurensis TaxID=2058097 RepID=A0A2K5AP56_9ARCH|nr:MULTISPECIES: SufD family Fe-S cluster assembly protein [Candidatus Nitrosocaldus]SPC33423.1 putative FeS cluster assembly protein sufD [Candidatus Nitrosocaldus cavascurensis]
MMESALPISYFDDQKVREVIGLRYNEPAWLIESRVKALSNYRTLPDERSPLFNKYTTANLLDTNRLMIMLDGTHELDDELKRRRDEIRKGIVITQAGRSIEVKGLSKSLEEEGLVIKGIMDALKDDESVEIIRRVSSRIDTGEDKFLALEHALFNSGLFIYVPKGMVLDEPITIIRSLPSDGTLVERNIVYADVSSRVRIVQELYSGYSGDDNNASNGTQQAYFESNECYIADNADVEFITTQGMSSNIAYFTNRKAFIARDARFNSYLGLFGGTLSRCKVDNMLEGFGASAEHFNIIFGDGTQAFDLTANMMHLEASTRGRVLSKAIVKDTSRSLFKGMINIGKDAKGSESYLAGHAIILNKGARADSIPALEIETNEVKATHSASVAQIDEEQIFYMMSRGMSRDEAKRAIVFGFIEPLLKRLSMDARIYTTYLVDCKWRGRQLMLRSDDVMREIWEVEEESRRIESDIFEKHYKYR